MKDFIYEGPKTREISFPLGGLGAGCIGLGGNGRFMDMEIFSRPNKGSHGAYTHFAVKAEDENSVLAAKVLQSDLQPPYMGSFDRPRYQGFGHGSDRASMSGMPHFVKSTFKAEFPIAELSFSEADFPGDCKLTAFSPMIPSDSFDSSLPGAMFEIEIANTTDKPLSYTVALSANNFYANAAGAICLHEHAVVSGRDAIFLSSDMDKTDTRYGDLTIVSDADEASYQQYWFRGNWFDNLSVWWQDFTRFGPLKNRVYENARGTNNDHNYGEAGCLASRQSVAPGEKKTFRFVLAWSNPYMNHNWLAFNPDLTDEERRDMRERTWKNWYATQFATSKDSAGYLMDNFQKLYRETRAFADALHNSSMPQSAIDAVSSTLSVLKSPTCLRLSDGSFYAFEGVHPHEGSCEGTCTHVWSYAYAMAFLFPDMERSARSLEYRYSTDENGDMGFRMQLPIGSRKTSFRACVDGQYGTILRTWREFLISGDIEWLKSVWPKVKKCVEFAWSDENPDKWDLDKDGVMEGRQHHTLDMELFGPSSWLSGMYLSGLNAARHMAEVLGDDEAQAEYAKIFESGREKVNKTLFNGEYFIQNIDLGDDSILDRYSQGASLQGETARQAYWDGEHNEIKYQIGEGSSIDQLLGQWHADILGLEPVFDRDKVQSALKSIYKYNFVTDMRKHVNPCRLYCLNDEQGLVICAFPSNRRRPVIPAPYAEETMHGFEYAASSHMIMNGMTEEGMRCVKALRDRYDGERRNPFNEIECGSNYARSMASFALLLAFSGFRFDAWEGMIGFTPIEGAKGRYFWSLDSGWGEVEFRQEGMLLNVAYGSLAVKKIITPFAGVSTVEKDGEKLECESQGGNVLLSEKVALGKGESLLVRPKV